MLWPSSPLSFRSCLQGDSQTVGSVFVPSALRTSRMMLPSSSVLPITPYWFLPLTVLGAGVPSLPFAFADGVGWAGTNLTFLADSHVPPPQQEATVPLPGASGLAPAIAVAPQAPFPPLIRQVAVGSEVAVPFSVVFLAWSSAWAVPLPEHCCAEQDMEIEALFGPAVAFTDTEPPIAPWPPRPEPCTVPLAELFALPPVYEAESDALRSYPVLQFAAP